VTEVEWMRCNEPEAMLEFCQQDAFNARKNRLFAVACCRLIWKELDEREQHAVEVSERFADNQAKEEEFKAIALYSLPLVSFRQPGWVVANARAGGARLMTRKLIKNFVRLFSPRAIETGLDVAVDLVRDIFGNPFRALTFNPSWLTSNVAALALLMYNSRDFSAMPILADALQDAGCDKDDILTHLRGPGPHTKGCWAVDLVLGKA